tara:strand:+ start:289 stop:1659 length:1371 start_codon:yes stop_codon:yes gene_type:complete
MRFKIWPTKYFFDDLGKDTRFIIYLMFFLYLAISLVKILDPDPFIKELQILYLVEKHNEFGLSQTKGFNLWTPGTDEFEVRYGVDMPFGGIPYDPIEDHYAYVSLPPGLIFLSGLFYNAFGKFWQIIRVEFIMFGVLLFYALIVFALEHIEQKTLNIFLLFTLTPFSLFHYMYNDMNHNAMLLSMSLFSYIFLLKYIKTKSVKWFLLSMLITLINTWFSYIALVTLPSFFMHLFFEKSFNTKEKFVAISSLIVFCSSLFISIILFHSMLPNSLDYLYERFTVRLNSTDGIASANETGYIPLNNFIIRQFIRFNTHFNPIAFLLSLIGLYYAIKYYASKIFNKKKFIQIDTLNNNFILIMLFFWGVPNGLLVVNGAYIHPYAIFYFNLFFIFGSYIGYTKIFSTQSLVLKKFMKFKDPSIVTIQVFLFLSVARALIKVSGLSLIDLFFNNKIPPFWG